MSTTPAIRELNSPSVGWAQISLDFGRDEIWSDIDDPTLVLSAAGLMVASLAHCLSKDDDWISQNEVLRSLIPGDPENKLAAATALCEVGVWVPEERGGKSGWRIGCSSALEAKRERFTNASNAARNRWRKEQEAQQRKKPTAPINLDDESPF